MDRELAVQIVKLCQGRPIEEVQVAIATLLMCLAQLAERRGLPGHVVIEEITNAAKKHYRTKELV